MSKKPLILIALVVLALSAIGVMAQDDGPGVINVTLPDGSVAPVFTDGRINGFDIGAPLVVYYKTEAGTIANPNFAGSNLPADFIPENPVTLWDGSTVVTNSTDNDPNNDG